MVAGLGRRKDNLDNTVGDFLRPLPMPGDHCVSGRASFCPSGGQMKTWKCPKCGQVCTGNTRQTIYTAMVSHENMFHRDEAALDLGAEGQGVA